MIEVVQFYLESYEGDEKEDPYDLENYLGLLIDQTLFRQDKVYVHGENGVFTGRDFQYEMYSASIDDSEANQKLLAYRIEDIPMELIELELETTEYLKGGFNVSAKINFEKKIVEIVSDTNIYEWTRPWSFSQYYSHLKRILESHDQFFVKLNTPLNRKLSISPASFELVSQETLGSTIQRAKALIDPYHNDVVDHLNAKYSKNTDPVEDSNDSFLRIYIPAQHFQAEQVASFVQLFENYLNKVENQPVTVDTFTSKNGKYYVFKIQRDYPNDSPPDFNKAVTKFTTLMRLCKDNPMLAVEAFSTLGVSGGEATKLIAKYGPQYNWLLLQSKHAREAAEMDFIAKSLMLRQSLEADVATAQTPPVFNIPVGKPSETLEGLLLPVLTTPVSIESQAKTSDDVARHNEDVEASEITTFINENAKDNNEAISLQADLAAIQDESLPASVKKDASKNLKEFALKSADYVFQSFIKAIVERFTPSGNP